MSIPRAVVVAVGGAAGAGSRWAVDNAVGTTDWPWVLLVLNGIGSFVLGFVMVAAAGSDRGLTSLGIGVGFCGGLTTFSSFAVVAVRLLEDDRTAAASVFVIASLVLACAAVVAGMKLKLRVMTR